jgi:hypothetical protein
MRLTGFDAIEYAEQEGLTLNKLADSIDDGASGLTIAEAEAIADEDADLIWLDVPEDEYYGERRNMEPGTELSGPTRLAGQRRDELAPGQNSGERARDSGAIGTPGGGTAAGGLAGTNAAYAVPVTTDEPQSGRSGGAVGGTPAGKRVSPR